MRVFPAELLESFLGVLSYSRLEKKGGAIEKLMVDPGLRGDILIGLVFFFSFHFFLS